jgi:hypothetical protein
MSPEYFAGFFDGEGCISLFYCKIRPKKTAPTERVMGFRLVALASNTDQTPLVALRERYGGAINLSKARNEKLKAVYSWRIIKRDAMRSFLTDIAPYTLVKKPQIDIALRYLATVAESGKRIGQQAWDERLACYLEMQALNKRGAGLGHNRQVPPSPSKAWNPRFRNLTKEQLGVAL